MYKLKTLALALTLAGSSAITATSGLAIDDIVIYRSTNSNRCTQYYQPSAEEVYDEEADEFVTVLYDGGRHKFSTRRTTYVIFNKSTGEFREVGYQTTTGYDMDGKRTRTKEYFYHTDYDDVDSGYTPSTLFETDPESRRNYLVLSLHGTGYDSNHFYETEPTASGDNVSSGVLTETVAGAVRLQRIRSDFEILECPLPSSLTGEVQREIEEYFAEDDQIIRTYCRGRITLRLDKARTREFINGFGVDMEDAEDAVIDYLERRGYVDGTTLP